MINFIFWSSFWAKDVSVVAVGIGSGVKEGTLREIAGEGNPVVQVKDFSMLDEMLDTIKGLACSGEYLDA